MTRTFLLVLVQTILETTHNLVVPIGLGFNLWFTQNVGLNVNMGYDLTPNSENYLHASAGLAFRWGSGNAEMPNKIEDMGKIDPKSRY